MLSMYKKNANRLQSSNKPETTGHDKFCRSKSNRKTSKKRRRFAGRQTQSAQELNQKDLALAAAAAERAATRSRSSDQVARTPLDSLAKFLPCISLQDDPYDRHAETYGYTALEPEPGACERQVQDRKTRERASSICVSYLCHNPRYLLLRQLNDIGSRMDKHWFLVKDQLVKTERLLTLTPRTRHAPTACGPHSREAMRELFRALQHPYIHPVLDVDFHNIKNKCYMVTTMSVSDRGSLKDLIYGSQWDDDWSRKYGRRGSPLAPIQSARLGRQILEALLFLRERGFPAGHLHSGNVVLQHGVARLSGLEAVLLGARSRIQPLLSAPAASLDCLAFGHVLFEMCAGYELDTAAPGPGHLLDLHAQSQVLDVLELIFENRDGPPTLEALLRCDFFRNIDLREMRNQEQSTQVFKTFITPAARDLLVELRGGKRQSSGIGGGSAGGNAKKDIPSPHSETEQDEREDVESNGMDSDVISSPHPDTHTKEHRRLPLHCVADVRFPARETLR